MAKNKLSKFKEMDNFPHVFQYTYRDLINAHFPLKGKWREMFFKNKKPIVLELGCGRGEYAVSLAERYPDKNYIGIDIKGARMWTGAKESYDKKLPNVAFLRTHIEMLTKFFEKEEVDEIWITFPDPQMKKTRKRLTSTNFLHAYSQILKPTGIIHLKTDSNFLYTYTLELIKNNNLNLLFNSQDVYQEPLLKEDPVSSIQTYYEQQWIERGLSIRYLKFIPYSEKALQEPEIEIELDTYRSYNRSKRSQLEKK